MSQYQASFGTSTQGSAYYALSPLSSTSLFKRFPVLHYIEECGLPLVHAGGKDSDIYIYDESPCTLDWPTYHDLKRSLDVRLLTKVVSVDPTNVLARHVKSYLQQFTADKLEKQSPAEGEANPFLLLPCPALKTYHNDDMAFLSNIQNKEIFIRVMQNFVLGTISELIRVMERLPIESTLAQDLKFKISNGLCPVDDAHWDLFTLPPDIFNRIPLLVVFVPPWHFGLKDMDQFASAQKFKDHDGALDTLNTKLHSASDIIWAIIYDVLKGKGHKFILTNYNRWVFGFLNPDYTMASTTEPYQANFLDEGLLPSQQNATYTYKGCNVVELLVYWTQMARGRIQNPSLGGRRL